MSEIKKFEDLEVWQLSRLLAKEVWEVIEQENFKRNFALRNQIDHATGSIMDNISEGFGREGRKEFIQYLSISKGSCSEVKSQLYRALDRGFISQEKFERLYNLADRIGKMISGLMKYLKTTQYTGSKFKEAEGSYAHIQVDNLEVFGSEDPTENRKPKTENE